MAATLADQSDDPWSQLRIPQDSREQLWHGLQETQTRLYYDAAMASAPDDSNLSLDNNYGPLHGSQSELEAFPQDPSIGVRSPGINSYNHEASDGGRRRGGRQRGSHLPAETANNARTVRQVGSCLRCMTLREQVSVYVVFQNTESMRLIVNSAPGAALAENVRISPQTREIESGRVATVALQNSRQPCHQVSP